MEHMSASTAVYFRDTVVTKSNFAQEYYAMLAILYSRRSVVTVAH